MRQNFVPTKYEDVNENEFFFKNMKKKNTQ